jgi:tRNA dimethylallyltransferase
MNARVGILTGPTASGKTAVALGLAARHGLEIVNADSLLVYRGLDVGTAKPTHAERARVPHHLVDIRDPDEPYTAADFRRDARAAIDAIHARGGRALVVGGTGFYLKALLFGVWDAPPAAPELRRALEACPNTELYAELFGVDPDSALRIGGNDRYRLVRAIEIWRQTGRTPSALAAAQPRDPDPRFALWVVDRQNADLESRIARRTREMLDAGLIDETRRAQARWPGARPLGSIGYAQVLAHEAGRAPAGRPLAPGLEGLRSEIELATRQLVKKQRTFLRGLRGFRGADGAPIARWFHLDADRAALDAAAAEVYP